MARTKPIASHHTGGKRRPRQAFSSNPLSASAHSFQDDRTTRYPTLTSSSEYIYNFDDYNQASKDVDNNVSNADTTGDDINDIETAPVRKNWNEIELEIEIASIEIGEGIKNPEEINRILNQTMAKTPEASAQSHTSDNYIPGTSNTPPSSGNNVLNEKALYNKPSIPELQNDSRQSNESFRLSTVQENLGSTQSFSTQNDDCFIIEDSSDDIEEIKVVHRKKQRLSLPGRKRLQKPKASSAGTTFLGAANHKVSKDGLGTKKTAAQTTSPSTSNSQVVNDRILESERPARVKVADRTSPARASSSEKKIHPTTSQDSDTSKDKPKLENNGKKNNENQIYNGVDPTSIKGKMKTCQDLIKYLKAEAGTQGGFQPQLRKSRENAVNCLLLVRYFEIQKDHLARGLELNELQIAQKCVKFYNGLRKSNDLIRFPTTPRWICQMVAKFEKNGRVIVSDESVPDTQRKTGLELLESYNSRLNTLNVRGPKDVGCPSSSSSLSSLSSSSSYVTSVAAALLDPTFRPRELNDAEEEYAKRAFRGITRGARTRENLQQIVTGIIMGRCAHLDEEVYARSIMTRAITFEKPLLSAQNAYKMLNSWNLTLSKTSIGSRVAIYYEFADELNRNA